MKVDDIKGLVKYVIVDKESGELLFDDRLFDRTNDAKNAFKQLSKCYGKLTGLCKRDVRFDDQDLYEIKKVLYTVQNS